MDQSLQSQAAAASQAAVAAAPVTIAPQPEECRKPWPLLPREKLVGHEALDGIGAYESYLSGTINPAKRRCWQFNEDIRTGLAMTGGQDAGKGN